MEKPKDVSWSLIRPPAGGFLRRPISPGSLTAEVLLTPAEARSGGTISVAVPLGRTCTSCDGTGGESLTCSRCGGVGRIESRMPVPVQIPGGVRDGVVFQVHVDDPSVSSVFLTVHIRGR